MSTRTEINEVGEFGLIQRLSQGFIPQHSTTHLAGGDDTAVVELDTDYFGLLTTELFLEGVDFDLTFYPLKHLGYKVVAASISDIAAMNGVPQQLTVGLGVSNRFSVEALEELYEGIRIACDDFKVDLVGGDTTSSRAGLVLSVSVLGRVKKDKITYRSTAQPNDILCVTGDLGAAYLGLTLLEREKQVFLADANMQPQLEGKEYIVQRQLRPEARMDVVYELDEAGVIPTAMIDLSDGLASDLMHLCTQSKLGAVVFEEHLPIEDPTYMAANELGISPITAAINGGEDYELLFTIRQQEYDKIKHNPKITAIGFMTEATKGVTLRTKAGAQFPLTAQGWTR